jgi:YidC/Oxa1 family membrane protein insertase
VTGTTTNTTANNGAGNSVPSGVPAPVGGGATNAATTMSAAGNIPLQDSAPQRREIVQITTDVLKVDFDTEGGNVVRAEFL